VPDEKSTSVNHLKLDKVVYYDQNHHVIAIKNFSLKPDFKRADTRRPSYFIGYDNTSSTATTDVCYPKVSNVDAVICAVQGGSAQLYWYVGDQGDTAVAFYADGPSANIAASNTFSSSQIDELETIDAAAVAPIAMNDLYHVYETCNGTICGEASVQFGVLCSIASGTCPSVTMTDNNTGQQFTPNDSATPFSVIGAQQAFSGSQLPGTGSGAYIDEGQSWSIAAGDSDSGYLKGYTFADDASSVKHLGQSDISAPNINFYWTTASSTGTKQAGFLVPNPITFSEVLERNDDEEISIPSITESYSVEGPVGTLMTGVSVQPTYGPYRLNGLSPLLALHMGTEIANTVSPLGVSIQLTGVMPLDFAGSVSMTRLVNFSTASTAVTGQQPAADVSTGQDFWVDTCALYTRGPFGSGGSTNNLSLNKGAPIVYTAQSAPAYFPDVNTVQTFDAQEIYHDYFMFKPNTPNSIWVAVANEDWSWSGLVAQAAGKYQMITDSYPTSPFYGQSVLSPVTADGFNEPEWTHRRFDGLPCHAT